MKRFTDAAEVTNTRLTSDGYMVAEAFAVRSGIQIYLGSEVGLADKELVRVYRPEDEVRNPESLGTFSHAPITLGHPEKVDAANWKDLAVGEVSTEAQWVDGKIKLPLILKDQKAIAQVQAGTRELSAGYTCKVDFTSGVTPDGQLYDAIQRDIRINHLAIVPKGRAGSECRIPDAASWGVSPITTSKKEDEMSDALKTVVLGDKAPRVHAEDAHIIDAYRVQRDAEAAEAKKKAEEEMAEKEAEIAKKDAEIDALKAKVLSDADLTKLVSDRAKLLSDAAKVAEGLKFDGLTPAGIRKAVVEDKLGKDSMKDRSDDYIEARFDLLVGDAGRKDKFADTLRDGGPKTINSNDGWDKVVKMKKGA